MRGIHSQRRGRRSPTAQGLRMLSEYVAAFWWTDEWDLGNIARDGRGSNRGTRGEADL